MKVIDGILQVLSETAYPMTVDEILEKLEKLSIRKSRDIIAANMSNLKSCGQVVNGESDYSSGRTRLTWMLPGDLKQTNKEPVIEMSKNENTNTVPALDEWYLPETMAVAIPDDDQDLKEHPLYAIFMGAIRQAMYGKGERHGGAKTPFLKQPWVHYADLHGRGFLTGQAAKKLEEAASTRSGESYETEAFGAMVYIGMSIIHDQKQKD